MAGGFPVGFQLNAMGGTTPVSSGGVSVTASGTANTVGSYVELITSTPRDSTWALITVREPGTATTLITTSVNIATGASGSEVVQIANLVAQHDAVTAEAGNCSVYFLPFAVPAGTRLAANAQSTTASTPVSVGIILFDDAFGSVVGGGAIDTIGFTSSGGTHGTAIDPGTSANTKGAYAQLTASSTYDIAGFALGFDGASGSGSVSLVWTVDVAIGASGSEIIVLPDVQVYARGLSSPSKAMFPNCSPYLPIQIPAGSRIAVRAQCISASSPSRLMGVTLYGARA
jgi:hypothetical protein